MTTKPGLSSPIASMQYMLNALQPDLQPLVYLTKTPWNA